MALTRGDSAPETALRLGPRCALLSMGTACVGVVAVHGELSGQALVAVVGSGTVLTAVGLVRRAGAGADPVGRSGAPWLVWVVAAVAWELLTFAADGLPTLSDLMDPVLAHPAPRGAATVGWLVAGAWLVTRPGPRGRAP